MVWQEQWDLESFKRRSVLISKEWPKKPLLVQPRGFQALVTSVNDFPNILRKNKVIKINVSIEWNKVYVKCARATLVGYKDNEAYKQYNVRVSMFL